MLSQYGKLMKKIQKAAPYLILFNTKLSFVLLPCTMPNDVIHKQSPARINKIIKITQRHPRQPPQPWLQPEVKNPITSEIAFMIQPNSPPNTNNKTTRHKRPITAIIVFL